MALIGIQTNRNNPPFTIDDFTFWMPNFTNFMNTADGKRYFNKLYPIANNKIFKSIFGSDWEMAMSLCIAHYATLIANTNRSPSGNDLSSIIGGANYNGIISSASVGGFSKTFDLDRTMITTDDAKFWNQTSYGAQLMSLWKTKANPSIMVVTPGPIGSPRERGYTPGAKAVDFDKWDGGH